MMRRGFTLFEVIVALGLSVALMSMIGFAMQFYVQQLNVRDSEARRTQLARSILRMIAEDLQSCVYPLEFDSTELAAMLSSTSAGQAGGGGGGSTSSDTADDAATETDDSMVDEETLTPDLTGSLISTIRPGLIGNQFQIQFDVSRLPRMEEYLPMMIDPTEMGIQDIASDVKTVSYFVQQAEFSGVSDGIAKLESGGFSESSAGGLVRRSLSREVTGYATESGDVVRLTQTGDLVAEEVVQIEFAYFDGSQWLYEWNSDNSEGLPLAVQIRLTMSNGSTNTDEMGTLTIADAPGMEVYDLIVKLPMAQYKPPEEVVEEDLSAAGI